MSTQLTDPKKLKNAKIAIYAAAVAIPLVVALLFKVKIEGVTYLHFLPALYAKINAITAVFLIIALYAIKQKNIEIHRKYIRRCLVLSILFLACYVAYHMTNDNTAYKGEYGNVYYPLLISHIILSVAVVPIVLFTYLFAWQGDFIKHKKWTRFAWPIWFYVSVTGVIVYWMISPYYVHN